MPVKILVADDSVTMRKIMEMTFAGEDAEVTTVDSGDAAVQTAKQQKPDVVFADASMDTDGYAVAQAIKGEPDLGNTRVILLDSQHHPFDEGKAKSSGVDDHVAKPFDSQAVLDKVSEVMSKPRAGADAGAHPGVPKSTAGAAPPPPPPAAARRPPTGPSQGPGPRAIKSTMGFGTPQPRTGPGAPPPAPPPPAQAKPQPSKPVLELADDEESPTTPGTPSLDARRPSAPEPAPRRPEPPRAAPSASPAAARPSATSGMRASVPGPAPSADASTSSGSNANKAPSAAAAAATGNGSDMAKRLGELGLSQDQVNGVLQLSREVIEQVVWEVVPDLAETIIREEIKRLTSE